MTVVLNQNGSGLSSQQSSSPRTTSRRSSGFQRRNQNVIELIGVFKRQKQQWDDTKLISLEDGTIVKVEDPDNELRIDQTYRFHGRWYEHYKYGRQFLAENFSVDTPLNRDGVIKYLMLCDNIGRATAVKLWDKYQLQAFDVLRDTPEKVVADGIMTDFIKVKEASEFLQHDDNMRKTKVELFSLFQGYGFGRKTITYCLDYWGAKAAQLIRRDPFRLMVAEIPSAGFKRCDALYLDLGLPAFRLKRQMLSAWYDLHSDSSGNTWWYIDKVNNANPRAIELGVRAKWLVVRKDENGKQWITEKKKEESEQRLAYHLGRLLSWTPSLGDTSKLLWPTVDTIDGLSDHQKEKLTLALTKPVAILCGPPGTGKTYVAAKLIKKIIESFGAGAVRVCAPTGKAAVRVAENLAANGCNIGKASTIHRLLKITPDTNPEEITEKIPSRFIIIDEVSMCDTNLLGMLLWAVTTGTHILFIGDPYQLPPVGHGAPLRDMIASNIIPTGELSEIRRNAGTIVHACTAIKDGKRFPVAEKYNPETGDNLRFIQSLSTDDTVAGVVRLHEVITQSRYGFDPIWDTQVIVAMNNRGPLSRGPLNALLQKKLNPDGYRVDGNKFRVGDKIICLKNCTMKLAELTDKNISESEMQKVESYSDGMTVQHDDKSGFTYLKIEDYVANGEIGRVIAVGQKQTIAQFEAPRRVVRILHGTQLSSQSESAKENEERDKASKERAAWDNEDDGKLPDDDSSSRAQFDLAYAVTGHRMQGSEVKVAIVVIDPLAKMVCNREYIYTSVSRAKQLCILIGDSKICDEFCSKASLYKRKTFLVELLSKGDNNDK